MSRAWLWAQEHDGPAAFLVSVRAGALRQGDGMRPLGETLWLARGHANLQAPRFVAARCAVAAVRLTVWQSWHGAPTGAAGKLLVRADEARCGLCGGAAGGALDTWAAGHLLAPPWTRERR